MKQCVRQWKAEEEYQYSIGAHLFMPHQACVGKLRSCLLQSYRKFLGEREEEEEETSIWICTS